GNSNEVNRVYDACIEPVKTNSWIKTAALYQMAMSAHGEKRNYLLSKVFDAGGYNRTHCLVKFISPWVDSTLLLAKNNHERNVLMAMKAFNYPGRTLYLIKRIYTSEPGY